MPIYDGNWPAYWQEQEWERKERDRLKQEALEEKEQIMQNKLISLGDTVWVEFKGEVTAMALVGNTIEYTVKSLAGKAYVERSVLTKEEV